MNFPNRTLYHGDNLPFLRGMDSETVDLVATDPPFNKSKDFHATPDSLAKGARFSETSITTCRVRTGVSTISPIGCFSVARATAPSPTPSR